MKRCPRCLQSVFDLFNFLFLERNFLPKISRTVSFWQDLDLDVVDRDFFCLALFWLLSIFVLSGWIPRPTASALVLKSKSISRNFSSEVEKSKQNIVRESQIRQAVFFSVAQCDTFLFILPTLQIAFQWKLQHCVERQAWQRVSLLPPPFDRKYVTLFVC